MSKLRLVTDDDQPEPQPEPTPLEAVRSIVERLTLHIPKRPRPPPVPRASYKGFKVGDRFTSKHQPGLLVWEIEGCDSDGVTARIVVPFRGALTNRIGGPEEAFAGYEKVKKPRTKRKPKELAGG